MPWAKVLPVLPVTFSLASFQFCCQTRVLLTSAVPRGTLPVEPCSSTLPHPKIQPLCHLWSNTQIPRARWTLAPGNTNPEDLKLTTITFKDSILKILLHLRVKNS